VLDQVWTASQRYVRLFVSETVDDAMEDHRELYACCERRDGAHARDLLRRHLDRTEFAVREAFTPAAEPEAAE
jgi:DNA-binding GntR family transcriptional regulator